MSICSKCFREELQDKFILKATTTKRNLLTRQGWGKNYPRILSAVMTATTSNQFKKSKFNSLL